MRKCCGACLGVEFVWIFFVVGVCYFCVCYFCRSVFVSAWNCLLGYWYDGCGGVGCDFVVLYRVECCLCDHVVCGGVEVLVLI